MTILIALIVSILLHGGALVMLHQLENRDLHLRLTRTDSISADDADETPETDPELQREITPGITDGVATTMTWIGYREYEEHLARLADQDQAAMTQAARSGNPLADDPRPIAPPTNASEALADASSASQSAPDVVLSDETAAPEVEREPEPERVTPVETVTETEVAEPVPATELDAGFDPDIASAPPENPQDAPEPTSEVEPEPESESVEVTDQLTEAVREDDAIAPQQDDASDGQPSDSTEVTPVENTPTQATGESAETQGEPVDPSAAQSDLDSTATSTKDVPAIKWNNGKPQAIQGVEVRPYSLYRHIRFDSNDLQFDMRWSGRMRQNPVVSLRFDRDGRVASVSVARYSGYAYFDLHYLKTWLSRWTARDPRLAQLAPGQMTYPITLTLVFIPEPKPEPETEATTGAETGDDDDGSNGG